MFDGRFVALSINITLLQMYAPSALAGVFALALGVYCIYNVRKVATRPDEEEEEDTDEEVCKQAVRRVRLKRACHKNVTSIFLLRPCYLILYIK